MIGKKFLFFQDEKFILKGTFGKYYQYFQNEKGKIIFTKHRHIKVLSLVGINKKKTRTMIVDGIRNEKNNNFIEVAFNGETYSLNKRDLACEPLDDRQGQSKKHIPNYTYSGAASAK